MSKHGIKKALLIVSALGIIAACVGFMMYLPRLNIGGLLTHNFCPQQLIDPNADLARLIYETENLVGLMASILVAGIALFITLLLLYWNQNIDSISNFIMYIGEQIQNYRDKGDNSKSQELMALGKDVSTFVDKIEKFGKWLYIPYISFIALSITIIMFLIGFRFLFDRQISSYISLVIAMIVVLILVASVMALILIIPQAFTPEDKLHLQKRLIDITFGDLEKKKKPKQKRKEE